MTGPYGKIISRLSPNRVLQGVELRNFTTLKIGGPADLFYKAQTKDELVQAIALARESDVNFFILGSGTNVLFSDSGFKGLVIKNETSAVRLKGLTGRRMTPASRHNLVNKVYMEVSSGVTINRLVRITVDQGLSGLEHFLGQPGTVGGAVWINAHNIKAGRFFGDLVKSAEILSPDNKISTVDNFYFRFSYDNSTLQKTGDILLSAVLELTPGDRRALWETARRALEYRRRSQPEGGNTAGCLFKNIDKSDAHRLATPGYTCSAGFLLDAAGLKGARQGTVGFSKLHANFLSADSGAKSSDVLKLIDLAGKKVFTKFGVRLELEVVVVPGYR